jgi:flagellar FliL protein
MKKNLLSIIILFLLIVNISLTAVMMFSLVLPNQKALALMTDVATILRLELPSVNVAGGTYVAPEVALKNVETYNVNGGESMMIPLKRGPEDTSTSFFMARAALSMDTKNKGYKDTDSGDLSVVDTMIQDVIIRVFGGYSMAEVLDQEIFEEIRTKIIIGLHDLYGSEFIFSIQFRDVIYV